MKTKTNYFSLYEICLMALLSVLGMFTKPVVAPLFNMLTDLVQIPGGSVSAGFSMLFLVFATAFTGKFGTALLMGALQATLALVMGFTAQAGLLVYITYTLPGLAVDLALATPLLAFLSQKLRMMAAGALGVLAGAVMSNLLYFRLGFVPFMLFYILGILSGVISGGLACFILNRLPLSLMRGYREK